MRPNGVTNVSRNRGLGMIFVAVFATLLVMAVLALISPKVMVITASVAFVLLLARFIWLVRREF